MNSKLFLIAGYGAWYLTFVLGFFLLAPSTDDGYYVIASMGTALNGSPGFWIGDHFVNVFFLPTAFTFFYGLLLKMTIVLGTDFGPLGFRIYQFLFIFLLPLASTLALKRLFPRDYGIRLLLFLTLISLTYFVQSAPAVRPEVLGALLFLLFLSIHKNKIAGGAFPAFILALSGTTHPVFTLLALAVFGVGLIRKYQQVRFRNLITWFGTFAGFGIPFGILGIFYLTRLDEFREQTLGRASFLSTDAGTAPAIIFDHLSFWNHTAGIQFGLFSGYPAYAFVLIMLFSTSIVIRERADIWGHETLWICWPILAVQWFVFLFLPAFIPYLGFTAFFASLIVVVLLRPVDLQQIGRFSRVTAVAGFALCLVFIVFQGGKFLLDSEDRLTPAGLHSAMSPILKEEDALLYTSNARLIPPLIDYFSENGNIRINFMYLSPDCLQPHLLELADQHALSTLTTSDPVTTYWGLDSSVVNQDIGPQEDGSLTFYTKGSHAEITIMPSDLVYADRKNLITRASSVAVKVDEDACTG